MAVREDWPRPELPAETKEGQKQQQRWRLWWRRRQAREVPLLLLLLLLSLLPRLFWLQLPRSGWASWQRPCAWEEEDAPRRRRRRQQQGAASSSSPPPSSPLPPRLSAFPLLLRRQRRRRQGALRPPLLPLFPMSFLLPLLRSLSFSSLERRAEPWACLLQWHGRREGPSLSSSSSPVSVFSSTTPAFPSSSSSLPLRSLPVSVSAAPRRPCSWSRPSSPPRGDEKPACCCGWCFRAVFF